MKHLSKEHLAGRPEAALLTLPEKVLQFGTGVLLRGLPDCLIDQANRQGIFNGRVVVVKSTDRGDSTAFERQDGLYTICTRGIENGQIVAENTISTAISRVLSAQEDWAEVLACAANPLLRTVISNTTEIGIRLVSEDVRQMPPASFPGKLLAFLYARFRAFQGDVGMGLIIVPTELLPDNGTLLESIIFELAHLNRLELQFIEWMENACVFCNSLVDRIVPGAPPADQSAALFREIGYRDDLLIVAEPYRFWAIEGDADVAAVLSFHKADPEAVVILPDIGRFRERKLRLLNGTHSLLCGLAHLAGFRTVSEAMENEEMAAYTECLMLDEIAPAIPLPLPSGEAETFSRQVLDRFRNPLVEHNWLSIAVQYTSKIRTRIVPLLLEHYRNTTEPPAAIALGFAGFLVFCHQPHHLAQDDHAAYFLQKNATGAPEQWVPEVLSDETLWVTDLSELPGFAELVSQAVEEILEYGVRAVLQEFLLEKHEA